MTEKTLFDQFADAYRMMAQHARYRPNIPSDGFGNPTLSPTQIRSRRPLEHEAQVYAEQRFKEDRDLAISAYGCANFTTCKVLIFAVEAAELMMFGMSDARAFV